MWDRVSGRVSLFSFFIQHWQTRRKRFMVAIEWGFSEPKASRVFEKSEVMVENHDISKWYAYTMKAPPCLLESFMDGCAQLSDTNPSTSHHVQWLWINGNSLLLKGVFFTLISFISVPLVSYSCYNCNQQILLKTSVSLSSSKILFQRIQKAESNLLNSFYRKCLPLTVEVSKKLTRLS